MADDVVGRDVVGDLEGAHEFFQGTPLLGGVVGLGFASVVDTADEADTEGRLVETGGVSADFTVGAALLDFSVAPDDVVVADALPAPAFVPDVDVLCADGLIRAGGGAVDDEHVDLSD